MSAAMMTAVMDMTSSSEAAEEDPAAPDIEPAPTEPTDEADLGASAAIDSDTGEVTLELGADETGSLAAIIYVDSEDDPDNFYETYEARFYLVPEGVNLSDQDFEERSAIPGQQDYGGSPFDYELEDFEAHFGLELLATTDLDLPANGLPRPEPGTMRDSLPTVTANADVAVHYLESTTDGDELITFLNEDYVVTRNGLTEEIVTQDAPGTTAADWLATGAEGLAVNGGAGDDILIADHGDSTLIGGDGDDTFEGVFAVREGGFSRIDGTEPSIVIDAGDGNDLVRTSNATVDGGAGDDTITIFGGLVSGGDGDDQMNSPGPGIVTLNGAAGDDTFIVGGAGSEAFGGEGRDVISVEHGALGHGEAGDDTLQLGEGGAGFGGDGDDLFAVWNFHNAPGATVTGGDGADTIDARVRNALGGETGEDYLTITDFDPDEDVLQIGTFNSSAQVDEIEILEATDGSHTDIRVTYDAPPGLTPGVAIIRIDGTPGVTADHIVITA